MKELSVVEMNEVSGAGWGALAGAGVGFLSGILAIALVSKITNETTKNRSQEQSDYNYIIAGTSTALGALSGAIAEARS